MPESECGGAELLRPRQDGLKALPSTWRPCPRKPSWRVPPAAFLLGTVRAEIVTKRHAQMRQDGGKGNYPYAGHRKAPYAPGSFGLGNFGNVDLGEVGQRDGGVEG